MGDERKKDNLVDKIKRFFANIFGKNKVKSLPEPMEESKVNVLNKEDFLNLYKKIKERQVDIKTLTREELIMFIKLGKEEIKFLEKRIENEKTECNMYQKEIDFYQKKLAEIS
jgi:hypothetical protein